LSSKGNSNLPTESNLLGTTDETPLIFRTNNEEVMRLDTNGNVGIGTISPAEKLTVARTIKGMAFIGDGSGLTGISRTQVNHTNTGDNSELVTSLLLTNGSPYTGVVIFSQELQNVQEGEIIMVLCQFEATNDLGFNVMVASQVILADSPTTVQGIEITESRDFNISPAMHHGKIVEVGTISSPENYGTSYVNVIAYAASTKASTGNILKVEQDYGRLSVLRYSSP